MLGAKLTAINYYLPKNVVSNETIAQGCGADSDFIYQKLGVKERHFVSENESSSTMAVEAIKKLVLNNSIDLNSIEFLLVATQNPDNILPGISSKIQNELKLPANIAAFDLNLACSAYPYLLSIAAGYFSSGLMKKGLIVTSECYSKRMSFKDKTVCTLFGDAASATLIEHSDSGEGFLSFDFGTDGSGYDYLVIPAGGTKLPSSAETSREVEISPGVIRSQDNLIMDGREIFNFVVERIPSSISDCLDKAGLSINDIDYFVFHQANQYMLKALSRRMNIPDDKMIIDMENYGNTVSSTIPIVLSNLISNGKLHKNNKILMSGFGVGLSWSSCIYNY